MIYRNFQDIKLSAPGFGAMRLPVNALLGVADRMLAVGTVPCTSCHYCVSHCPQQIKISEILADFSDRLG